MIRWLNKRARCACLFAGLLAALAGCTGDDTGAPQQQGTFETTPQDESVPDQANIPEVPATPASQEGQATFVADQVGIPQEPVIGTVTPVPGTEPAPPETTGGEAIPLTRESEPVPPGPVAIVPPAADRQIVLPRPEPVVPPVVIPQKVTRFTEIAPDTIGGATHVSSPALSYDLGNLVTAWSNDAVTFSASPIFITPVKGWLRYPQEPLSPSATNVRFPIIIFLHGSHNQEDPSYQGYDYLARDLATHGYLVLSIDANKINGSGTAFSDLSSQSRAQLVLGTLDRLRQIDLQGQVDAEGNPGVLNALQGKLDFERIGIMGHSRGGQGIANTIKFNVKRRGVTEEQLKRALMVKVPAYFADPIKNYVTLIDFSDLVASYVPNIGTEPASIDDEKFRKAVAKYNIYYADDSSPPAYQFRGAFLLAPTDLGGVPDLNYIPLATLLPSCDGDVKNLEGSRTYDHNRFGPDNDMAPRYQIMVKGANHNFYNTIWLVDDQSQDIKTYCSAYRKDSIRLNDADQRRSGLFIINSFMRYHVGGERKFSAYWNGTAQLPSAACPIGLKSCDERVVLTIQKNVGYYKLIQRFVLSDSLLYNLLRGAITFSGFDPSSATRCNMPSDWTTQYTYGACTPKRLDGFQFTGWDGLGMLSVADHVELAWSEPKPVKEAPKRDVSMRMDLLGTPTSGYDSLTFRVAVVQSMGQEIMVTLADQSGHQSSLAASDFSDALYNAPRPKGDGRPLQDDPLDAPWANNREARSLLNMVAIPLKAFEGVDLTKLKELKFAFPKASGKVAITDIELQNLGREKPAATVAARQ